MYCITQGICTSSKVGNIAFFEIIRIVSFGISSCSQSSLKGTLMKLVKLSATAYLAAVLLSGCAPLIIGAGISGGLLTYGNKQRENCAAIYDKAASDKWSAAKTKAEAYRAGCQ
jgi:hypothetical protein